MPISKTEPIAIIGGGVFGLSTALQLATNGYTDITVFEKDEQIPAPSSAAYDLNKIVRAEYEDPFYAELALQAIDAWKTPLYAPHYHQTGYLLTTSATAPAKAKQTLQRALVSIANNPRFQGQITPVDSAATIRSLVWQYSGALTGWTGYFNRLAGYAHSADALAAVYRAAQSVGVRFYLGSSHGAVTALEYDAQQRCTGVRTADGRTHAARTTIVAAGAYCTSLLPALGTQIVARAWSVAHVQLTADEASKLRGIPVTYARDIGFLFEPDPKTNLLKLCPMGGGYTNSDGRGGSVPAGRAASSGWVPVEDERRMRRLLRETMPELAERELVDKKMCWFADSADSDFVVDWVPGSSGSVVVLSGDSGQGFKFLPVFGQWVQRLLEAETKVQAIRRWRWKETSTSAADGGDSVSWRVGASQELSDVRPKL